jgi:hypothetical protein
MPPLDIPDGQPPLIPPIVETFRELLVASGIPCASDLYDMVDITGDLEQINRVGLLLRTDQIDWLLSRSSASNNAELRLQQSLKRMIHSPWVLSSVLIGAVTRVDEEPLIRDFFTPIPPGISPTSEREFVTPAPSSNGPVTDPWNFFGKPGSIVGPIDCAVILSVALTTPMQQGIIRLLVSFIAKQPREYFIAVLCEICGNQNARGMGGVLMTLLDYGEFVREVLEEKLGQPVPRKQQSVIDSHLDEGSWMAAKESYFHACCELVLSIVTSREAEIYHAVKTWVQVCYRTSSGSSRIGVEECMASISDAIIAADKLGTESGVSIEQVEEA